MKTFINQIRIAACIIVCFSLAFSSCKKDDNDNPFDQNGSTIKTSVMGTIIDTDNKIVKGATVRLGTNTSVSDEHGVFAFINVEVPKDRMVIKATKAGFFNCIKAKKTQAGEANYLNLMMEEKPAPVIIQSSTGGVVNIPGGAQITFPANAFADANGNAYTGSVKVFARHINPGNDNFEAIVPGGDLLGISTTGQVNSLRSLGMVEALLTDNGGVTEVKLAAGITAEIKFPIDPSQASQALATIPLWHLDENTGIWQEEGQASKSGNTFVGNVSHFSFWNCDYPGIRADVIGKVTDCNGQPAQGIVVTINGFMNVTTNNNGEFVTWVPATWTITYQVLMANNPTLTTNSPVITFTAQAGITNIIPTISINCATRISGSIFNCDGSALSPATIYLSFNGGNIIYYTSTGVFNQIYVPAETNLNITARYLFGTGTTSYVSGAPGTSGIVPPVLMCLSNNAINHIGFNTHSLGVTTYYDVQPLSMNNTFTDINADGVFEQATINITGVIYPSNQNCNITISLNQETDGYYSLLSSSQNSIFIQIDSLGTIANGLHGNLTANRFVVTDYGLPGGSFKGRFEFDFDGGEATDGTLVVPR